MKVVVVFIFMLGLSSILQAEYLVVKVDKDNKLSAIDQKDEKDYAKIRSTVEGNEFPVAIWPEKFLLGPYKATLTIALSDSGPQFKKQIIFFALPAQYLLGILIIFTIVVFITIRIKKAIRLEAKKS